jgi:SOS-response transcriptional repressor LexA
MAPNPDFTFLLHVGGHAMIEARIFPGDGLIVDRSITPPNRHIVVVDIEGKRSVERLPMKGGHVRPRHSLTTFLFTLGRRFTPPLQPER